MDYLTTIIIKLLKSYKTGFDRIEVYKILHSDPAYPNAISLIRTLSFWGINTGAYKTDYEHLILENRKRMFDYFDIGKCSFSGIAHFIYFSHLCTRK